MNNPHVTPMIKRFAVATAILFAVAVIMVTSIFNMVILTPTAVVAQTQRLNSNTSSSQSTNSSNPLSRNSIFKQVENSVVQITSKTPTTSNSSNQSSSNTTTLGSGFVYDKQGHIITNRQVVGNAKASVCNISRW